MKLQLDANGSPESSDEVQEHGIKNNIFPIPITGILWVITMVLGVIITLMIFFVSLAFWVVTKNPFFIISVVFGGFLFIIWGYINLKDKDRLKKTGN